MGPSRANCGHGGYDVFLKLSTISFIVDDGSHFPGTDPTGPLGRSTFEWLLGGRFLRQRTEFREPGPPECVAIIEAHMGNDMYTQHYFDDRGVARLYSMTLNEGIWQLHRDTPDFTPLEFRQRFTGRFTPDGNRIDGEWEICHDSDAWEHDFEIDLPEDRLVEVSVERGDGVFVGFDHALTGPGRRTTSARTMTTIASPMPWSWQMTRCLTRDHPGHRIRGGGIQGVCPADADPGHVQVLGRSGHPHPTDALGILLDSSQAAGTTSEWTGPGCVAPPSSP